MFSKIDSEITYGRFATLRALTDKWLEEQGHPVTVLAVYNSFGLQHYRLSLTVEHGR